jgi:CheY-like chemotaxis protein
MEYRLDDVAAYATSQAGAQRGNVLIVDDEEIISDIFADWLEDAGHSVTVTYEARDGLLELDESIDVVVLDRGMAVISGDEFLEIIRSDDIDELDPEAVAADSLDQEFETKDIRDLSQRTARKLDEETLRHVQETDIDCQVCIVSAVDPDFDLLEMEFDNYITKGAREEEVVEAVELLLALDELDDPLGEYWTKGRKRAVIKRELSRRKLNNHDGFQQLEVDIENLEAEHDDLLSNVS